LSSSQSWTRPIYQGRREAAVQPLLLAWRRVDVDNLNTAARAAWDRLGRLSGPELEAPGGRRYRFGDRVLMLSPGPAGAWVTSEHATIVGVNLAERSLTAYTPDGRVLHLDTDAIGAERLTHAYALTVHRAQGVTADTAHVLEHGAGATRLRRASNTQRERRLCGALLVVRVHGGARLLRTRGHRRLDHTRRATSRP